MGYITYFLGIKSYSLKHRGGSHQMSSAFTKRQPSTIGDKVAQIIKVHSDELTKLEAESENAINTFKRTATQLETINTKIDESIELMDSQISNLVSIKEGMATKRSENEKVRNKILDFLS